MWAVEVIVCWKAVRRTWRIGRRVFDGRASETGGRVGTSEALGIR